MRVIGKTKDGEKKVSCRNCGTLIAYFPIDVEKSKHTDYTGGVDINYFVKCPKCLRNIYVEKP